MKTWKVAGISLGILFAVTATFALQPGVASARVLAGRTYAGPHLGPMKIYVETQPNGGNPNAQKGTLHLFCDGAQVRVSPIFSFARDGRWSFSGSTKETHGRVFAFSGKYSTRLLVRLTVLHIAPCARTISTQFTLRLLRPGVGPFFNGGPVRPVKVSTSLSINCPVAPRNLTLSQTISGRLAPDEGTSSVVVQFSQPDQVLAPMELRTGPRGFWSVEVGPDTFFSGPATLTAKFAGDEARRPSNASCNFSELGA